MFDSVPKGWGPGPAMARVVATETGNSFLAHSAVIVAEVAPDGNTSRSHSSGQANTNEGEDGDRRARKNTQACLTGSHFSQGQ